MKNNNELLKMKKIYFAIIKLTSKGVKYSEFEYNIITDENEAKYIKSVKCWNGTKNLPLEGTELNKAWANEFPRGIIESKMWCDKKGLKTALQVLKTTLDTFLIDFTNKEEANLILAVQKIKTKKIKLTNVWNKSKHL